MEKSFTLKKSEIDQAYNFVANKVGAWTSRELSKLAFKRGKPQCVAITDNVYRVGNYTVRMVSDALWEVVQTNDTIIPFSTRNSAILFSLTQQSDKFELADKILYYDNQYQMQYSDYQIFKHHQERALKTGDKWKYQLSYSRKRQAHALYKDAQLRLRKCLRLAKYNMFTKPKE